jgi:hypothetical protein
LRREQGRVRLPHLQEGLLLLLDLLFNKGSLLGIMETHLYHHLLLYRTVSQEKQKF